VHRNRTIGTDFSPSEDDEFVSSSSSEDGSEDKSSSSSSSEEVVRYLDAKSYKRLKASIFYLIFNNFLFIYIFYLLMNLIYFYIYFIERGVYLG